MNPLLDDLDALAEQCRGALVVTARGPIDADGEALERAALGCSGGEWVEVAVGRTTVAVEFAGWAERWRRAGDDPGAEDADELAALVLDFVAAAVFGELRVIEERLAGRVLRRRLEVRVGDRWRGHARQGRLGLAGVVARLRGRVERRVRGNEGRLARPRSLATARCSGQPGCPWSGAALGPDLGAGAGALAIDGELDLHNFAAKEAGPLVREYLEACLGRGIHDLRIVHGKGKGVLRRTVHAELGRHPAVASYRLGGHGEGSWGATIVRLRQP